MIAIDNLNPTERGWLVAQLATSYRMKVNIEVLDLDGKQKSNLSNRLMDGQVNIDNTGEVVRTASLTFFDPLRTLSFDPDSASDTALFVSNMVRIEYGVFVTRLNRWVNIPVFTGPVAGLARDEDTVKVECVGKEHLAMGPLYKTYSRNKGLNRVELIKDIMQTCTGETQFDMPVIAGNTQEGVNIAGEQTPWLVAQKLAEELDRQLFYDGNGTLVLRQAPTTPVFTFTSGNGGTVTSTPQLSYDISEARNTIVVTGTKGDTTYTGTAIAGTGEVFSPIRLGRNGVPRYLVERIEGAKVSSVAEAEKLAESTLKKRLVQAVGVSFDALVNPLLEEGDTVRVQTDEVTQEFIFDTGSIPLVVGNTMSVGYTKRMGLPARTGTTARVFGSKHKHRKKKTKK